VKKEDIKVFIDGHPSDQVVFMRFCVNGVRIGTEPKIVKKMCNTVSAYFLELNVPGEVYEDSRSFYEIASIDELRSFSFQDISVIFGELLKFSKSIFHL
jgi:hypothetical protein